MKTKEELLRGLESHPDFTHHLIAIAILTERSLVQGSETSSDKLLQAFEMMNAFLAGDDTFDRRVEFGKFWRSLDEDNE